MKNFLGYFVDILVLVFIYVIPLILFIRYSRKNGMKKYKYIIISLIYIVLNILFTKYTYNLFPFILVAWSIYYLKRYEDYDKYNFRIKTTKVMKVIKYSALSYLVTITISIISMYIFTKLNLNIKQQEIVNEMAKAPMSTFIFTILPIVVFAPVVEEFVFRWYLFEKVFSKRIGVIGGAIITSLIFAFVHFNLKTFPVLLTIALINCYIIHKKGYWYSVFNHLIFNGMTTLALLVQKLNG